MGVQPQKPNKPKPKMAISWYGRFGFFGVFQKNVQKGLGLLCRPLIYVKYLRRGWKYQWYTINPKQEFRGRFGFFGFLGFFWVFKVFWVFWVLWG